FRGAICVEYEYNWDNSAEDIGECATYFNTVCEELALK
ncbi:MAG: Inosose dehydratase, partial [Verrucomicrobiaceae bacterium]|nr:Inosose dehydratase [Verrucomicrobiaceae bacterium]